MKPASLSPTLRVDALGALAALALTAGAALLALGPSLFTHTPTHAEQQAQLDARSKETVNLERQTDAAHKSLNDLKSQSAVAVQLKPANTINQRLGDMAALAEHFNVTISQLTPGQPAPASAPTTIPDTKATIISIKLAGTGFYPDISRFLHDLHDHFRDTALSSLKISAQPDPNTSEKQLASFSFDLAWYAAPAASDASPPKP